MLKNQKMKSILIACFAVSATLASQNVLASLPGVAPSQAVLDATEGQLVNPNNYSIDKYAGLFTFRGKTIAGLEQVVTQIWTGYTNSVNGGVITYNFSKGKHLTGLYNNPNYGFTAGYGLSAFSEAQKASARDSVALWDDLIAPSFVEKGANGADIQFANSYDPGQAYAYYPEYDFTNAKGWKFFGDVFVATPEINWSNAWLGFGGYGVTTVVHEVGHSLGLSHPGAYNGAGATSYLNQAEYAQDSNQYSIMSYWSEGETSNQAFGGIVDWSTGFYNNAQTPMVHDILSIQAAYGADPTTRSDDTVYGWNSTAGKSVFDFSQNLFPFITIYDAGGNDTIDMSGANASVFIDLNDGEFSSGAASVPNKAIIDARRQAINDAGYLDQFGNPLGEVSDTTQAFWQGLITNSNHEFFLWAETGVAGLFVTSHDNIAIAYGTTIENAIGSSERDFLKGNEADNVLTGNAGADVHVGGAGSDTFVFTHIEMGDEIGDFTSGEDTIDLSGMSFSFVGNAAFSNTAGELRYDGSTLMGDVDGDGAADLTIGLAGAALDAGDLSL